MFRRILIQTVLASSLLVTCGLAQGSRSLTDDDVVSLTKGGLPESTILTVIQAQPSSFELSPSELLKLKQNGVSQKVMDAMLAVTSKQPAPQPATSAASNGVSASIVSPPSESSEPASQAPAKSKRSWFKAIASNAAVGQTLTSVAARFTNGAAQTGGSVKSAILSRLSGVASGLVNGQQPDASGIGNLPQGGMGISYGGGAAQNPAAAGTNSMNPGIATQGQPVMTQPAAVTSVSSSSSAGAGITFVEWREPREGAFTMNVPQGWQVTGGIVQNAVVDSRQVVRIASPDGQIRLFLGDGSLVPHEAPDPLLQYAGIREGQTIKAAWGGNIQIARYQSGEQFAHTYAASGLCRAPQFTQSRIVPDATQQLNQQAVAYGRTVGAAAQAVVGEAAFNCGEQAGYVRASTVLAGPPTGRGAQVWDVLELSGFMVANPQQASLARYVLNSVVASVKMNPQWEARHSQQVNDITGQVTRAQQAMAASIQQHAAQEAAQSRNHPNDIDVMSGWEARNKEMDATMQHDSDVRRGVTTVVDPMYGTTHTVPNDYNYQWTRPDGTMAGTMTDTPPDYSNGWRMMVPANQ